MTALLVANDLSWKTPAGPVVFQELSFSLGASRVALVGRNGIGKSTLLRILVGELEPHTGSVERRGTIAYLPQDHQTRELDTVAMTLGIAERLGAIEQLEAGNYDEALYPIIGDDWEVETRARRLLDQLGLASLAFDRELGTLSGGEQARVVLASLMVDEPDLLVLDEPTNHLDETSRQALYDTCRSWQRGLLVVSHDRSLLDLMDETIELSPIGLKSYGGNFTFYAEQKAIEEEAAARQLARARDDLARVQREQRAQEERQRKRSDRGRAARLKNPGSQSRAVYGAWKESSERTTAKVSGTRERKIEDARAQVSQARELVDETGALKVDLPLTEVPAGKRVCELSGVSYRYPGASFSLRGIDLTLAGPERVALRGPNGSGKTTLVRLLLGQLRPDTGTVELGVERTAYLDQNAAILDHKGSILANLRERNPALEESEARTLLARFLFLGEDVFKRIGDLSGGERMRAAIACLLVAAEPPQLLVLDEPTNNLDLDTVAEVTRALAAYRGALLVISHDVHFLDDVGVHRHLVLDDEGGLADRVVDLGR